MIGHQKSLARLRDDTLADAHFFDVEVEQITIRIHCRTADHRDVEFELADRLDRQVSDQTAVHPAQCAAGQHDAAFGVVDQNIGHVHVVRYHHQIAVVKQGAGHCLGTGPDI